MMRAIVLMFLLVVLGGCADTKLQERVAYWQQTLDVQVPVGMSKDDVIRWGEKKSIKLHYDEQKQTFFVFAETVPESWPKYPCASWVITLVINLDANGQVADKRLEKSGRCV